MGSQNFLCKPQNWDRCGKPQQRDDLIFMGKDTNSTVQIRLEPRTNDLTNHYVLVVVVNVSLDATSAGIGLFCRLMPFASNSALPCTATRARCFSMSTPNEARDLSSNHGSWARSWISPCTQTSEMNPNSKSHRRILGTKTAHFERSLN